MWRHDGAAPVTHGVCGRRRGTPPDNNGKHIAEERYKKAADACRHKGGVQTASGTLLTENPAVANEETYNTVRAKSGMEDGGILVTAADTIVTSKEALASTRRPPQRRVDAGRRV